ncbi:MAG: hypothetical protein RL149_516 [Actinomycetota bacterium]|jgi:purine-cytosine permease-like protein
MPRQKWRGISIFGMTNPFVPPQKRAFSDAELAEALEMAQLSDSGALGAMELLEEQSRLRAEDAQAYVQWVRAMETDGSPEAKEALSQARLTNSGIAPVAAEVESSANSEDSWKNLVPDWDDRQQAIEDAKLKAIEDAKAQAEELAEREIESAVAAAIAEVEFEAELRREEAVAAAKAEAEARAAEQAALEQARAAEQAALEDQQRLEAERIHAEELAEQQRLEEEARLELERLEAQEREQAEAAEREERERAEAAEREERERLEAEEFAELERAERIRVEIEAAEQAAAEALLAATVAAELAAEQRANELAAAELENDQDQESENDPEPVRAADFATGSFDIIESAEQAATEEFDEDNFEILLSDGEIGFAKEPKSGSVAREISSIERRAKSISQLFVWSSITVGIAPILLAYLTLNFELTVIEKITAVGFGVLLSALLITVVAIGGKRSGLPTLFLSRSAFGVNGNMLPALLQIATKFAFGAVLLVVAISLFNGNIVGLPALTDGITPDASAITWLFVIAAATALLASILALLGGKVLYWAQLGAASVAAIATISFIATTAANIQLPASQLTFSSNWFSLLGLSAAVATGFGAFWVNSVADFTRKIPMGERGRSVAIFVVVAAGLLPLAIASYAIVVAGGLSGQVRLLAAANPLGALLSALPDWAASTLLVSAIVSLLVMSASWMYSTSVSLSAVSRKLRRFISQPIVLLLVLISTYFVSALETSGLDGIFAATSAISGVIVFAWAGIFVADIGLRKIAYHEISLTRDYGFYRAYNWVNLTAFAIAIAIGLGFVSANAPGFEWLGYIANSIGANAWAESSVGVFIALGFSVLFPLLFGRGKIALQEQEVLKIEARKGELNDLEITDAL